MITILALILQLTFTGPDRELAQGAIERHDLAHREIEPRLFLVEVKEGTPEEWAKRLTAALPENSGRFDACPATDEQVEKLRKGEITLQK